MPNTQAEFETIAQAAARLGCHANTIRRRIASGELAAHRFGPKLIRLEVAQVNALLRPIPTAA